MSDDEPLCSGTAYFDYWLDQDFAYVFADASTTFVRWLQGATALSQTWVTLNGLTDYGWSMGSGLIVESWAGWAMPTWTCSGSFQGMVSLSGLPSCTPATAYFYRPLNCY